MKAHNVFAIVAAYLALFFGFVFFAGEADKWKSKAVELEANAKIYERHADSVDRERMDENLRYIKSDLLMASKLLDINNRIIALKNRNKKLADESAAYREETLLWVVRAFSEQSKTEHAIGVATDFKNMLDDCMDHELTRTNQ